MQVGHLNGGKVKVSVCLWVAKGLKVKEEEKEDLTTLFRLINH